VNRSTPFSGATHRDRSELKSQLPRRHSDPAKNARNLVPAIKTIAATANRAPHRGAARTSKARAAVAVVVADVVAADVVAATKEETARCQANRTANMARAQGLDVCLPVQKVTTASNGR